MVFRRSAGVSFAARATLLAAIVMPGLACVGTGDGTRPSGRGKKAEGSVQLPEAEQMIDEIDRAMTSYGTIGVKTPDVWGQDRLAKFRCEYEAQMAEWLKVAFKGEINASVRRTETSSTLVQVGANGVPKPTKNSPAPATPSLADEANQLHAIDQERTALDAGLPAANATVPNPARVAGTHRGARRAFQLPQPPQPVAAHQRGGRPGRPAGIRTLSRPDPGDALARAEEPEGQGGDHQRLGQAGHVQAHAAHRACGTS